jgi:hypothetical protein
MRRFQNVSVPLNAEADLVALEAGLERKAVNLVKQNDARADAAKPRRRVGADEGDRGTVAKHPLENSLIGVAGLDVAGDLSQDRRVGQHRQNFRAGKVLAVLDTRQHHQDRRWILMHVVADSVIEAAGVADPRTFHDDDLAHRRIGDRVEPALLIGEGFEPAGHGVGASRQTRVGGGPL